MANARRTAVMALVSVNSEKAYSNITLNKYLNGQPLEGADRALAAAIFYGVLDRRITIDYILSKFIKTPLSRIKPFTLEVLRSAVFQILFMDKIPESAAVNEAVKLIKKSKESFNSAFVNGVLRNIIRNPVEIPNGNDVASLSVRFSCPEWIINVFIRDYGEKHAVKLLESSLLTPPVTLRVNTLKTNTEELKKQLLAEGIETDCGYIENSLVVLNGLDVNSSECYKKGLFHIQDTASQKTVCLIGARPGERIMDVCSAPGGKSFTMAQYMMNEGEIRAFDLYEKRAALIERGAKRLGLDIIKAGVSDAAVFDEKLELFDAVLCDVPCSGLGVIRRKPEIKYKQITELEELKEIQLKILSNSVRYLKAGGRLVYSTCTLNREENEGVVKAFLDKHTGYELKYEHTYMPHIDGADGFYCAFIYKSR